MERLAACRWREWRRGGEEEEEEEEEEGEEGRSSTLLFWVGGWFEQVGGWVGGWVGGRTDL